MEENPGLTIFDIIDPTTTASANSSFVMSVTTFRTKILTAFENEIRGSFALIVKYHVMNTFTNFKQKLLKGPCSTISHCGRVLSSVPFSVLQKIRFCDR